MFKKIFQKLFYKVSPYSQAGQDIFALELFGKNGTYIDIGAALPIQGNNTYMLETQNNWTGFALELNSTNKELWKKCNERKNKIYWEDAITFDYHKAIKQNNLTIDIDFLSCDIDPPENTLKALKKIFNDGVRPKLIAFETDFYKEKIDYSFLAYSFLKPYGYNIGVKNVYSNFKKKKIFETWFVKNTLNYKTVEYNSWVNKNFKT